MQCLQNGGRGERSIASRISLESTMRRLGRTRQRSPTRLPSATPNLSSVPCKLKCFRCNAYKKQGGPRDDFSRPGKVYQDHVRMLLHSLENNVLPVGRDVEVADVEVGCDVGQLALHARLQID